MNRAFYTGLFIGTVFLVVINQFFGTTYDGGDKAQFGLTIGALFALISDQMANNPDHD
ncbi:hypothetical protein [Sphingomonas sp. Leaf339]|uniref:hypothetical protein n=1 Tax=Sphingomonas sp. Leaf339 TaxID=1736343 RepID=UPI000B1CE405|nr:hypothetical protein [Sphingomonas sp. Leaf339]